jgi:hypothetical protein
MQNSNLEKTDEQQITYHVHAGIIRDFLCPGGKEKSIPRLFKMTQCWTQGTYDSSACISSKRMLQYASEL